jgi:predicted dienelactone hydrolase
MLGSTIRHRSGARLLGVLLAAALAAAPALAVDDPPETLGPWDVGHRTTTVFEPPHLPAGAWIYFDIWYPVDSEDWVGNFTSYMLMDLLFTQLELDSTVAKEDVDVSSTGNRGLIVFSHGSGSLPVQSVVLTETLASHGFVVVAPRHYGNNIFDNTQSFAVTARQRPKDVSYSIDYMLARNADDLDDFYGSIDTSAIGVTGHSFGGFTALAMASGYDDGVQSIPPDTRVKVIVPVSPAHFPLDDAELKSVALPTLCMAGTLESFSTLCQRPFALTQTAAPVNYRVDIIGATHSHFANICDIGQELVSEGICPSLNDPLPNPPCDPPTTDPDDYTAWEAIGAGALIDPFIEACVSPALDIDEVNRLQNLYTVSLFRRHLLGETDYDEYLTLAYAAQEPLVRFFTGVIRVPVLTTAGTALLGGLLAASALWSIRRSRSARG